MSEPETVFQNPGLIDIRAVTTIGVSVKKAGSIGVFGTGLKASIAILLRHGQEITIYRGLEAYVFTVVTESIGGEDHEIVYMNGSPLGFTTHYGLNWSLENAYREIMSNALDEAGFVGDFAPMEGMTTIVVGGDAFALAAEAHDEIFLESEPLFVGGEIDIHEATEKTKGIYYRGIRVFSPQETTLFAYNIRVTTPLTEDRTLPNATVTSWSIGNMLERCTDPDICEKLASAGADTYEGKLDYDYSNKELISEEMKSAAMERYRGRGNYINPTLLERVRPPRLEREPRGEMRTESPHPDWDSLRTAEAQARKQEARCDAPRIPENTCPMIDEVLEIIASTTNDVNITNEMEELREANETLRGGGIYWYEAFKALLVDFDAQLAMVGDAEVIARAAYVTAQEEERVALYGD